MKTKKGRILLYLSLMFGFGAFLVVSFFSLRAELISWSEREHPLESPVLVEFPRATSLEELSSSLKSTGLLDSALLFRLWVRFYSDYPKFQAGSYRFLDSASPREIAAAMIKGDVYTPVVFQYTIPEGFTLKNVVKKLVARGVGTGGEFEALLADKTFLKSLGLSGRGLEGYLYPATYTFSEFPSPREALSEAVRVFWKELPEDYEARVEKLGLSLHKAVIFASLIELETPHDDERNHVSEVIWRRLKRKIPLAIDSTLIYGIEDYRGNITRKHLRDAGNKYNSRIHRGLPPTPISSPSIASLLAVLTPSDKGYLYFVVDADSGDSRHHFSRSVKEHNRYVRKLVAAGRRARKAK